jgi:hypothetical protein
MAGERSRALGQRRIGSRFELGGKEIESADSQKSAIAPMRQDRKTGRGYALMRRYITAF